MSLATLEKYEEAFGFPAESLIEPFDTQTPYDWRTVRQHKVHSETGSQDVVFFSPYEHSYVPDSPLLETAKSVGSLVGTSINVENLVVKVEGRVRKPPSLSSTDFDFSRYGELGAFESAMREAGVRDDHIQAPEPSRETIQALAQQEGLFPTLAYFVFRQIPQIVESNAYKTYPYTEIHMQGHLIAKRIGLEETPRLWRRLLNLWNDLHPTELHMKPGHILTPDIVAAIRAETVFLPCLKVPERERNPLQHIAVIFNIERQLGFLASFAADLSEGKDVAFGFGRMHALALETWMQKHEGTQAVASWH